MTLKLASNLSLPTEAVTQTFAILAKRGVGKTYTASVMVEEMLKANLHVVVIDPIGVWWGLRSSADGKKAGLPIVIAGGEHADVPIEPASGEVLAGMIVDQQLSMVIDISLFRKGEQHRFMVDFAETLYRKNRKPVHLVLDEADEFAPQRTMGDEARMLGAIEDLVRRGRARGIGVTMITQRPAVLNKNVLTQIEVLVALRLTSPQDRAAIAEWVKYHADGGQANKMLESLGSLPVGTAWFWSPGWLDIFKKVAIRKRETLDSSSTPKVGQQIIAARKMAVVDLEQIRQQLSQTIEKAAAEDPKMLRQQIAALEKQVGNQKPQIEIKEVAIITDEQIQALTNATLTMQLASEDIIKAIKAADYKHVPPPDYLPKVSVKAAVPKDKLFLVNDNDIRAPKPAMVDNIGPVKLGPGEEKILIAAAERRNGVTRKQLTVLTGYKRSTRNAYLQRLQQWGLVTTHGERVLVNERGIKTLGTNYTPMPTGKDLRIRLLTELPTGEAAILRVLMDNYPNSITRDQITELTGYMRSTRNVYLQRMSAREIIETSGQEVRASVELFEEVS